MRSFSLLAPAVVLAGQVFALSVPFGGMLGNLTALQLVDFSSHADFVSQAQCSPQCGNATSVIQNCNNNDTCTCSDDVGTAMLNCDQCLFTHVVDLNILPPDPRIGSQAALDGFVAACLAAPLNITVKPLKMKVPPSWLGPQSNHLSVGLGAVTVIAGAILGSGSLYVLSNLE